VPELIFVEDFLKKPENEVREFHEKFKTFYPVLI